MLHHRISALRRSAGLSQQELAQALHVSPSTVGMYEQGRRVPGIDMLIRLAEVFHISLDLLLTGAEFRPEPDRPRSPEVCPCDTCFWRAWQGKG